MQCFNKYYQKSWQKRLAILKENGFLDEKEINQLETQAVDPTLGDTMIENFVTQYQLPEGLAMNYVINGKELRRADGYGGAVSCCGGQQWSSFS